LRADLRRYIESNLLDGSSIEDDEDLLLSGKVDSLGMMRLIAHIEETWHRPVPLEDVTIENFSSIETITKYLSQRAGLGDQ
jgi:acyl carrier protein